MVFGFRYRNQIKAIADGVRSRGTVVGNTAAFGLVVSAHSNTLQSQPFNRNSTFREVRADLYYAEIADQSSSVCRIVLAVAVCCSAELSVGHFAGLYVTPLQFRRWNFTTTRGPTTHMERPTTQAAASAVVDGAGELCERRRMPRPTLPIVDSAELQHRAC